MKPTFHKALILVLLIPGLFADGGSLFASQKMRPLMNNGEMQHDLSTNEALLMQFKEEKATLLREKAKNKQPHLLKNKLKILDAKITFLQNELKRTKPVRAEKKQPAKPVSQAPQASPVVKAKVVRAPLAVSWRPYARPEPRRRIFLAQTRQIVKPQPIQRPLPREEAVSITLPKKIQMQDPAQSSSRNQPMMGAVSQKVEVPVSTRVQAQPVKAAPVVRPVAAPGQKIAKTGHDWKQMTEAEKDIYALSVMGNLGRRDIFLEKGHSFYIRTIDERLQNDPALENEYVHKILIASAYENEPESRQDLDKIGK